MHRWRAPAPEGTAVMEEAVAAMRDAADPHDNPVGGHYHSADSAEDDSAHDGEHDSHDRSAHLGGDGRSADDGGEDQRRSVRPAAQPRRPRRARRPRHRPGQPPNAQALLALCRQRLGREGDTAPTPARPSMLLIADLAPLLDGAITMGSGRVSAEVVGGLVPLRSQIAYHLRVCGG